MKTFLTLVFIFLSFSYQLFACGFAYVSSCNTFATIETDNVPTTYHYGACGWRTPFDNANLGSNLTDLSLTWGESTTWESCDNDIMDSKIYYRIYPNGSPSGAFQNMDLDQLIQTGSVYRTKTRSGNAQIDLLNGLQAFTDYTLEMYFESNVDTDNDGVGDDFLRMNQNGNNFTASFSTGAITTSNFIISFINQQNVSCNGTNDGAVEVTVTGGTPPYSYQWSNNDSTAILSNLPAGSYTVTVTDSINDIGFGNVSILAATPLNIQLAVTNAGCNQTNGGITASQTNGVAPFTYVWSNGDTTTSLANLGAGNYSLTVTDDTGCSGTASALVEAPCGTGMYCATASAFPWVDWISKVQFGTINNSSSKNLYSDYTDQATTVSTGGSYTISLTNNYSWATYDEYWKVWIDFNQDEIFSDSEAVVTHLVSAPPNGTSSTTTPLTITIPSTALVGSTQMRIALKRDDYAEPCETIPNGEVEDYTVVIEGGSGGCNIFAEATQIQCGNNDTPSDPSDDIYSFDLTVTGTGSSWTSMMDGIPITGTHGVTESYFGLEISDGVLNFAIVDADSSNCTYNLSITPPAPCSGGGTGPTDYCTSSSDFPWHDWISGVDFGGIMHTSVKTPYSDFTDQTGFVAAGSTGNPITVTSKFSWFAHEETWRVWIDYNRNGIFEEPSEIAFSITEPAPADGNNDHPVSGIVDVPPTATTGKTRMRVAMKRGSTAPDPCETDIPYGEVEDYSIIIQEAATSVENRSAAVLDFFAKQTIRGIELAWMSNTSEKNDHFIVEKSIDGIQFEPVYIISAQAAQDNQYLRWMDAALSGNSAFYRLRLIYWDGSSVTTHPQEVNFNFTKSPKLSPNPADEYTYLDLKNFIGQSVDLTISNQLGKVINTVHVSEATTEPFRLETANFIDGIYFIFIKPEGQKAVSSKLLIQGNR